MIIQQTKVNICKKKQTNKFLTFSEFKGSFDSNRAYVWKKSHRNYNYNLSHTAAARAWTQLSRTIRCK